MDKIKPKYNTFNVVSAQKEKPPVSHLLDPKLYLETYTKIKGKDPGLIPFILNEAQKDLFNTLKRYNRIVINKARQIGFSTAISGWMYHKTITTPGTTTALIAHKADVAADFLDRVKMFLKSTPEALRPRTHYNSKYEISFPDLESRILVMCGDNVGRGFTIHNALCSELAQWEKAEEMMAALEAAVPTSGKIVIESTPFGVGNLYHRKWANKDNGYEKKAYGWYWNYTQEEIDVIRQGMDPLTFAQEYELEFLASGRQVFDPYMIRRLQANVLEEGQAVTLEGGKTHFVKKQEDGLVIYKPPEEGHQYCAGADVAEGVQGGDYSVMVIFDRKTGEEVAMWRGHIAADRFGAKLDKWGRMYNNALMVVEINNHGLTTVTALRNLMYPTLYFRPSKFDSMGTPWSDRIGWKTSRVTRPIMVDDLNEALRNGSIILHSKDTIDEMVTFVYDSANNMIAMSSFHDDGIFGTAIALQGFKVMYSGTLDQLDYSAYLPTNYSY
jgi:hypothetical protein